MAKRDDLAPVVEGALHNLREKLIEPVTSAIVLAGIVLILSTEVKAKFVQGDGQRRWEIDVEKKAVTAEILSKFFEVFR
jgi:hypothetical protein